MADCSWCGTTEVELAENKLHIDCTCNCKRECAVCHKPYPNLKFYKKHNKRCNSCQSHYVAAKEKASIENNHWKFGDTTAKQKQYVSDEESTSSGEEKEEEDEDEYKVEDDDNNSTNGGVKKEDHSNKVASKTKNIQKASTPPPKRQLTVMK